MLAFSIYIACFLSDEASTQKDQWSIYNLSKALNKGKTFLELFYAGPEIYKMPQLFNWLSEFSIFIAGSNKIYLFCSMISVEGAALKMLFFYLLVFDKMEGNIFYYQQLSVLETHHTHSLGISRELDFLQNFASTILN